MGKKRTLASKRRQRIRQKKKKRLLRKQPPIVKASSDHPSDGTNTQENVPLDSEDEDDSFGSPGSPPPTPSDILSIASSPPHETFQMNEEAMTSEVQHLQEKCKSYKMLLAQKDESEHYFKKRLRDQQLEMEDVVLEAKRRVVSVRTFWRDQIFREQSRAGTMIKRAVCKK